MRVPITNPNPAQRQQVPRIPIKINPTTLAMAAAMMHQEGKFFKPAAAPTLDPTAGEGEAS